MENMRNDQLEKLTLDDLAKVSGGVIVDEGNGKFWVVRQDGTVAAKADAKNALSAAVENLYSNVSNLKLSDKDAEDFKYRYRNYESALLRISHDGYNDEAAAFNAEKSGFPAGLISAVRGIRDAEPFN